MHYSNVVSIIRYISVNPLTPTGVNSTQENSPRNSPNFATSPARLGWPARSRHTAACKRRFFSHTPTTRGAGSLVYVRVGSGQFLAGEDICGPTDHFQRF